LEALKKQFGFNSICLMPCNLYGPNDSFDAENSHVLSALVKKFVDAVNQNLDSVTLWGTGNARREFMHVNDMANATKYFLENYNHSEFINIGPGEDISIKELSELIANMVGFSGLIKWDITKPDGMLRKCMDVTKMKNIGFSPKISLNDGLIEMINIYKNLN
jgi:GDP-L-fucose synthase